MLPDDYIRAVADAVHQVGGLLVLDCIASGTHWIDMQSLGVDVLVSAPQKGWSGSPCCGLVMLSRRALERLEATVSTSFACDLKKWWEIMRAYENGGHAYHATMPTDALATFRNVMKEIESIGFDTVHGAQQKLGAGVRAALQKRGIRSVAAEGYQAAGVVVCYTQDAEVKNGSKFAAAGVQIAGGVPLQCDEPADFQTFRIGLFGLDKLQNVDRTIQSFEASLDEIGIQ